MRAVRASCVGALLWLVWLAGVVPARAADPDYRELAAHAGIIFRGTVEAVERVPATSPGEIPLRRITFRVQDAVRGARAGQLLTVAQWDGAGEDFRVGEMLLMFLYPPSGELGLTSTVGGPDGRVGAEHAEAALAAAQEATCGGDAEPEPDIPPPQRRGVWPGSAIRARGSDTCATLGWRRRPAEVR